MSVIATPVEPVVGSAVRDLARDRVGVVMGREGPYLQLRPLGGGREWDADPGRVRLLTHAEVLSARVAETNARSRRRLELGGAPAAPRASSWSGQDPCGPYRR
ncbi:hypothetical protein [Streptomyces qinglanensis]|uniref:hypothetical protein n=1 Tax=Streptomyces qinglanensis TaxID=943816 RepID=UPI0013A691FF